MSAVLTRPHRNLETVNSLFTFDDVQVDPGGLDVVRRALVRARVPRGRRPRDRQPRVDGVVSAVERRLHLGVPRRRRRDPLAVLEPATKPHFIIDVTGVAPFNKKLPPLSLSSIVSYQKTICGFCSQSEMWQRRTTLLPLSTYISGSPPSILTVGTATDRGSTH